ncbi:MAG: M14 family zinc carboxypeptidase [Bacteroidales bacterium]
MNWDSYPTTQPIRFNNAEVCRRFPLLCRLDTIGTTYRGRRYLFLKFQTMLIPMSEPELFFTSTMHGDELAGFVLMMRFAEQLLSNYTPGSLEEMLVDSLEIWINPS